MTLKLYHQRQQLETCRTAFILLQNHFYLLPVNEEDERVGPRPRAAAGLWTVGHPAACGASSERPHTLMLSPVADRLEPPCRGGASRWILRNVPIRAAKHHKISGLKYSLILWSAINGINDNINWRSFVREIETISWNWAPSDQRQ